MVTETWLSDAILDSEVFPPGYQVVRRDRASRGGGVAVILREGLVFSVIDSDPNIETCWVKIDSFSPSLVIGAAYRPPDSKVLVMESMYDFVDQMTKKYKAVILAGDFNLAHIDWVSSTVSGNCCASSELLLDMCFNLNMTQIVQRPTRIGVSSESVLDLVFVSAAISSRNPTYDVADGISDHKLVISEFFQGFNGVQPCRSGRFVYDFEKSSDEAILDELHHSLSQFENLFLSSSNNVEEMWLFFKNLVFKCLRSYVPQRLLRPGKRNPWITREVIHLTRQLKRLRHRKKRYTPASYASELTTRKSSLRKTVHSAKRAYLGDTLTSFLKRDPFKFWRFLTPRNESLEGLLYNDIHITEDIQIAGCLNDFFSSVFSADNGRLPFFNPTVGTSSLPDICLSQEGIFAALLNINKRKAVGPDDIPNEFLIRYAECCSKYLYFLFDKSLSVGAIPREWKCGRVIPIHKSGKKSVVSNYRPISLLCTVGKLLEHIVAKHISTFVEQNSLLFRNQHGFRRGLSTVTQLVEISHFLAEVINRRGQTDLIFLDFSKAFDRVSHPKLLFKLKHLLRNEKIIAWLSNYFQNRSQYVQINEARSERSQVLSGVPQGSVLGPLLFLLFINDLAVANPTIHLRLFADDLVIFSEVRDPADQSLLNSFLQDVSTWCDEWQMSLNLSKCVFMRITKKHNPLVFPYCLNGSPLEHVTTFKYLGVHFSSHLQWNNHVDFICKKAMSKLWFLRRNLKDAPPSTKLTAYKALVRPLLEYADVVWDPHSATNIAKLEAVQRKALRFIYNKYRRTFSVSSLYFPAGLSPLKVRRKNNRLKFFYSLVNGGLKFDHSNYLALQTPRSTRNSHNKMYREFQYKNDCFKFSFFPRTIRDWNSLSSSLVNATPAHFSSELNAISSSAH